MTLGEKILLLRRRKGLTQRQLGETAGINANTIARLERDEIDDPGGRLMLRLAQALETTVERLLEEREDDLSVLCPTGSGCLEAYPLPAGVVP